jgi:acetyl esterase/lipase
MHGGFWRMPWARDQMDPVASDLVARGFAVWNIEYRRLGGVDAAWPATLNDGVMAIDHLARLTEQGIALDLSRVAVVGHSAGGHLALYAAAEALARSPQASPVRPYAAVGLAPVADLAAAHAQRLGGQVVAELLGGSPSERPERYRAASPIERLPLGVRQLILHGALDDAVPIDFSRRYAAAACAAGDAIDLVEFPAMGHMEFLDPQSEGHATLTRWLTTIAKMAQRREN